MTNVLMGALVDEPPTWGCDCPCPCYARVDQPDARCEECERGDHVELEMGGEG